MSSAPSVKEQARQLIEDLPENADWDEVLERVRVRRLVERGLRQADNGETIELEQVRREFGLDPL